MASGLRKERCGGNCPTAQGSRNPLGSNQEMRASASKGLVPPADSAVLTTGPALSPKRAKPRDAGSASTGRAWPTNRQAASSHSLLSEGWWEGPPRPPAPQKPSWPRAEPGITF